jgi:hypothetical protein
MATRRICFYSDDSYVPCGKKHRHFVVAGVALEADRTNVNRYLLDAERHSGKGRSDWHKTRPDSMKARYLEAVLEIDAIRGRVFYYPFDVLHTREFFNARATALGAAITTFTPGDCHHRMFPEGLQGQPREQLKSALRAMGHKLVAAESAQFNTDPEVRLADALAGYIRGELYRGDGGRSQLTNLPDSFVNLEPKKRNPSE